MPIFNPILVAGGLGINGIIEQYKAQAGASVSAGDFVEFVNHYAVPQKSSVPSGTVSTTTAACLSGNKVLIIWQQYNVYYQYGVVATVENGAVTFGTVVKSKTNRYVASASKTFLIPLTDTTACYIAASSNHDTIAYICTVSGASVGFGSVTTLNSTCSQAVGLSVTKLSSTKLLIAHNFYDSENSNYRYLRARVLTISGTTITAGTTTSLGQYSGGRTASVALSETSAFVLYLSTDSMLHGRIVTMNGTTITAGTDTQISSTKYDGYTGLTAHPAENNRVFLVYYKGSGSPPDLRLFGLFITVNGDSLTIGTETILTNVSYGQPHLLLTADHTMLLTYAYKSEEYISGSYYYDKYIGFVEFPLSGGTVNVLSLNSKWISCGNSTSNSITLQFAIVLLGDGELFEAHSSATNTTSNGYLYYTVNLYDCVKYPSFAKPFESTISGIANSAGTGGQMVEVYVPKPKLTLIVVESDRDGYLGFEVSGPTGAHVTQISSVSGTVTYTVDQYGTYTITANFGHDGEETHTATFVTGGPTTITVSL